jgi:hypothetical protein
MPAALFVRINVRVAELYTCVTPSSVALIAPRAPSVTVSATGKDTELIELLPPHMVTDVTLFAAVALILIWYRRLPVRFVEQVETAIGVVGVVGSVPDFATLNDVAVSAYSVLLLVAGL